MFAGTVVLAALIGISATEIRRWMQPQDQFHFVGFVDGGLPKGTIIFEDDRELGRVPSSIQMPPRFFEIANRRSADEELGIGSAGGDFFLLNDGYGDYKRLSFRVPDAFADQYESIETEHGWRTKYKQILLSYDRIYVKLAKRESD